MTDKQTYAITVQQLQDFIMCPIYYNLKYKSKVGISNVETYYSLVKQVTDAFCVQLMNGSVMSGYDLKRKWNMVSKRNPSIIKSEENLRGISELLSLWRWAAEQEIRVADVGTPYTIHFAGTRGRHYYLKGTLGTTLVTKNNECEEFIADYHKKFPDQDVIDSRLITAINHIAFEEMFQHKLIGTKILHVRSGKIFYTIRDVQSEKIRLGQIVENVVESILNNFWYPHESPLCPSCRVKNFCRMVGM